MNSGWTRPQIADGEHLIQVGHAAAVADFAGGQDELRQVIHALRAQKFLESGLGGLGVAAVDQQIVSSFW